MILALMAHASEWMAAVLIGIGLAAATGFRVFLPLLVAGLAARWGELPLGDGFQWLAGTGALIALGTASVAEVAAYYIPGVDHLLDVLAAPTAFGAGVLAMASVMVDVPPAIMWPVALIGGGGAAATTKLASAVVRAKAGAFTVGLANPVVATLETAGAVVVAVLAILLPVAGLLVFAVWLLVIRRRRRRTVS
jgi:hypothetical protein